MKKLLKVFIFTGIILAIVGLVLLYIPNIMLSNIPELEEEQVAIPIRDNLENEILVGGLENKFIHVERVHWGGAGAGGLGAPQIRCSSIDNFIELVPKNETVYTSFETRDTRAIFWKGNKRTQANHKLTKIYWAFIENRAGMIFFEDNYQYKDNGQTFFVERFDSESVTFRWTNRFHVEYYREKMKEGTDFISGSIIITGILFVCGIFSSYYWRDQAETFFNYAIYMLLISIILFVFFSYLL